ncbi:MAG TPA: periplasmic heavy metal sensor [Anaeromyxobacteraceae bacterium]|nr:periplasmic heavy metal sensor [Anaeromyxobacteraceae bacterium]
MSPFLSGALGALAVVLTLAAVRRVLWFRRLHRWRRGGPAPLRFLFARLHTTPEQEAVISAEADALFLEGSALRDDWHAARAELAALFSAETLDAAKVSAALDERLGRLDALRARAAEALARVHAALRPEQRVALASLLERGPHGRHGCGHHRGHAHA